MKTIYTLILSFSIPLVSCGQSSESTDTGYVDEGNSTSVENNPKPKKKSKTLVMTPILNPQSGVVIAHIPLPKDWRIEAGSFIGPNGIITADYPNKFFDFQQRRPIPLEQVVREDLAPLLYQAGGKILGTFVIPEMENYDRAYSNLLWKFGNPSQDFNALGVDCVSPDGNRSLLILRQMISQSQYSGNWGYYINAMDANTSAYEEAKNDYIFALTHVQPNMEQIAAYNKNEIARSNASWAAHRSRMAANQAAFDARNQAWMESSNAISEASMKGWRSRFNASSAGQSSTINSINEEETIYDPASGQNMQVEAGSNRYFTNGNNEYIRTDDYFYEPGMDNSVNMYEWTEWQGNQ